MYLISQRLAQDLTGRQHGIKHTGMVCMEAVNRKKVLHLPSDRSQPECPSSTICRWQM